VTQTLQRRDCAKISTATGRGKPSRFLGFLDRKIRDLHEKRVVDGLTIFADDEATLDRVSAALDIIREHDSNRYRRLTHDLQQIWVRRAHGRVGWFSKRRWSCELAVQFVSRETTTPALLASIIVHEATHARLSRMGFGYKEDVREKVERICLRRELAFAAKVPGGIPQMWAEASLRALPDFSTKAMLQRDIEGLREDLRHLNMPNWLAASIIGFIRAVVAVRAWRASAGNKAKSG
jgi:hypothetical protein